MKNCKFSFHSRLLTITVVLLISCFVQGVLTQLKQCRRLPRPPKVSDSTTLSPNHSGDSNQGHRQEDKQQEILSRGMDQLHFDQHDKKAIFMLGNTGSGKTTITQMLNGNLSQLHAVLTHGGQMVIIDDQNRIGLPTTRSKTLVPEYVRNAANNVSFYDCPGFDDNRGPESDIASMYFVNAITEHVEQAKFLFIVTHSSLIMGHDRLDFDLLATHASQFLLNMTKFSNSIGLIVSKVSNYSPEGMYLSDDDLMIGIVEFLEEFNITLQENLQIVAHTDLALLQRKIQFVEALLAQDENENYIKIWFVRGPLQCGAFSKMPYYEKVKRKITDLYTNKLVYSPTASTDFGYTLKDKTLLKVKNEYVRQLLDEYKNRTEKAIDELFSNYQHEFERDFHGKDRLKIESIMKLNNVYRNLSSMQNESYSFSEGIEKLFLIMEYALPEVYVNETEKTEKVLRFYEKVTMTTIARPSLALTIQSLQIKVRDLRDDAFTFIKNTTIPNILSNMTSSTEQVLSAGMEDFQTDFENNFNNEYELKDALIRLNNVSTNLHNLIFNLNQGRPRHTFSQEITRLSEAIGYSLPASFKNATHKYKSMLQFYEKVIMNPRKQ